MKKALLFVLMNSLACFAQISGAGQLGCPGSSVTGSAWNSGTAGNTVQTLYGPGSASAVTVVIDQTTTITGGAVTFLGDFGDGNFVNVPAFPLGMINPTNNTSLANPYTLVASTNQAFFIPMIGMNRLQLKLSTALTGSGTITPFTTLWCGSVALPNASMNVAQIGGTAVDTNSGTKSAGTQRVVIANDQPALTNKLLVTPDSVALPANQSVNEAQINGVTPLMGNGTSGTGAQRVAVSSDNTPFETIHVTTATTTDTAVRCTFISAASTNATNCKASAGNIYGFRFVNTTTTTYYLRMYNLTTSPTCSSATGFIETIPIPPASAAGNAGGIVAIEAFGEGYSTGIAFCFTGGSSSTDNTNAATGVFGSLLYK